MLQRGEASAEAGAGVYFEERKALLLTLHLLLQVSFTSEKADASSAEAALREVGLSRRMLQVPALALEEVPEDVFQVVCTFCEQLLERETEGSCALLRRLLELIQDTSLEAKQDSRITRVVDMQGQYMERHVLLQRERSILCEVRNVHASGGEARFLVGAVGEALRCPCSACCLPPALGCGFLLGTSLLLPTFSTR